MEIETLRVFVEVARQGTLAAAARQLDRDPSWVSRAISSLEKELGVRLFQRTTRQLALTEAGAVYQERLELLLSELASAHERIRDTAGTITGRLRVTTSLAYGHARLVPVLGEWRKLYPRLQLDLLLTDSVVDLISERVDVAIRMTSRLDPGLVGSKLVESKFRVCASPDYVRDHARICMPRDLARHDCLQSATSGPHRPWQFRHPDGRVGEVGVVGSLVISSPLSLRQAALDGLGPALLIDWLVDEDLKRGALVNLLPEWDVTATDFDSAAWIVFPSRAYLPRKVRAFIDFARARLSETRIAAGEARQFLSHPSTWPLPRIKTRAEQGD